MLKYFCIIGVCDALLAVVFSVFSFINLLIYMKILTYFEPVTS